MCGIAGVFNFVDRAPVDSHALRAMGAIQQHRGPDAEGLHVDGEIGLAHRRLAIIDLDERGRQPMSTIDGRYVIAFNGEIYNFIELRDELCAQGHTFRTGTDTEVLLTLFQREGAACLSRLNGMFAFAVWDRDERVLFVARDRLGIKPLYYIRTPLGVAFASEAKALFEYPGIRAQVDESSIGTYMTFGYTPGERTLFRGVRKLQPAHYLTASARGLTTNVYWTLSYRPDSTRAAAATATQLHDLLLDAARIHMRSDVPVGVFLSGGLDSSAMVALLAEAGVRDIQTFSVAYNAGREFDETPYAKQVADHFGTRHHVLYVEPKEFASFVPDYVWHMDEPVTEAAGISLYFISRLLRKHVTVALSGEGSDELFGGYDIYRYMRWLELYRRVPGVLRRSMLDRLLLCSGVPKIAKYVKLAKYPLEQRYLGVSMYSAEQIDGLYSPELLKLVASAEPWQLLADDYATTARHDPLTRMLYADMRTWLVDDLLIKADKMTMANSVELRVPFLDHRVVEFAATIPSDLKIRNGQPKWILKRAMKGKLPAQIVKRRKVGFPTPLEQMFQGDLSGYVRDTLLSASSRTRGLFDPRRVEQLVDEHHSGARDHHKLLWQLLVLEEWHRRFIDAPIGMARAVGAR